MFIFEFRICPRKFFRDAINDFKMMYNIFLAICFSHEHSSDYEQNDGFNYCNIWMGALFGHFIKLIF